MAGILGLTSGKTFADKGFYGLTQRRQIFHAYPNGAISLTGLLSLMATEPTDNDKPGWLEKRFVTPKTQIAAAAGPAAPFSTGGGDVPKASPFTVTAGDSIRVAVVDSSRFKVNDIIWLKDLPINGTTIPGHVQGVITAIPSATKIDFTAIETQADVLNTTNTTTSGTKGPVNAYTVGLGNSAAENASASGYGFLQEPVEPVNFTQIFRTSFGFSGTSLKIPADFDKTGTYKEKAKDNALLHMTAIEKQFLFGSRYTQNVTDPNSGDTVPRRFAGGVLWFIKEWEKAEGGTFGYRPGGAAVTTAADSDDDKRWIKNLTGTMTLKTFYSYLERCFRRTSNKAFEKLILCGNGALAAVNALFENKVVVNKDMPSEDTYGMAVTTIDTIFGRVHFKAHPLFNEHPAFLYTMMILDIGFMKYRPLNDRDTVLLANRQQNDVDGRLDEWFTEATLELNFPESNMIIENVREITLT